MNLLQDFPPDTLVRAAFCSEANFSGWADPRGRELEVSRIMYPSPRTGHHEAVGGIFHSGDGYYLQLVEGPVEDVAWYIAHVSQDPRHKRVEVLHAEEIHSHTFLPGSMRYFGNHEQFHDIHERHGLDTFDPYSYTPEILADVAALAVDPPANPAALMGMHRD